MSQDELSNAGDKKQVSKARKIVSAVVLLGLLVLLGIEARAGFGQSMAANSLKAIAEEGVFPAKTVTEQQFNAKMPLWPTITEIGQTPSTIEFKYEWFSVVRPRMEKLPPSVLYATFSNSEPRYAMFFGTEPPDLGQRMKPTKGEMGPGGGASVSELELELTDPGDDADGDDADGEDEAANNDAGSEKPDEAAGGN